MSTRKYAIDIDAAFAKVFAELVRLGLLLRFDNALPSVVTMTVGESVRGSWWAHPLANEAYMVSQRLIHQRDSLRVKLINQKVTHVHRRLWPCLYVIGSAREQWQLHDLSAPAKRLLDMVDAAGKLRLDQIPGTHDLKRLRTDARTLENRLLVIADDVHTESGKHVKRIETWQSWAMRAKLAPPKISGAEARSQLEDVCSKLAAEFGTTAALPWQPAKNARAKVTAQ